MENQFETEAMAIGRLEDEIFGRRTSGTRVRPLQISTKNTPNSRPSGDSIIALHRPYRRTRQRAMQFKSITLGLCHPFYPKRF